MPICYIIILKAQSEIIGQSHLKLAAMLNTDQTLINAYVTNELVVLSQLIKLSGKTTTRTRDSARQNSCNLSLQPIHESFGATSCIISLTRPSVSLSVRCKTQDLSLEAYEALHTTYTQYILSRHLDTYNTYLKLDCPLEWCENFLIASTTNSKTVQLANNQNQSLKKV